MQLAGVELHSKSEPPSEQSFLLGPTYLGWVRPFKKLLAGIKVRFVKVRIVKVKVVKSQSWKEVKERRVVFEALLSYQMLQTCIQNRTVSKQSILIILLHVHLWRDPEGSVIK
jgi:hypothetical protein